MECGECTECCELFEVKSLKATQGNIIETIVIDSPAGEMCGYCEKNVGCKVHEERPKICREFLCAYAQHKNAPLFMRPDRCGIIFEKIDEEMFIGTVRAEVTISEHGMNQIKVFNQQGYDVVLRKHDTLQPMLYPRDGVEKFNLLKKFLKLVKTNNG